MKTFILILALAGVFSIINTEKDLVGLIVGGVLLTPFILKEIYLKIKDAKGIG